MASPFQPNKPATRKNLADRLIVGVADDQDVLALEPQEEREMPNHFYDLDGVVGRTDHGAVIHESVLGCFSGAPVLPHR